MQELRVEHPDAPEQVGVIEVPDGWFVSTPAAGDRAIAVPPGTPGSGEGFQPNVVVRIEPATSSEALPVSVLVLSDTRVERGGSTLRVRCTVGEMMGHSMMELVGTCRSERSLLSVVCTGTDAQWVRLAEDFDRVVTSARIDSVDVAVVPT